MKQRKTQRFKLEPKKKDQIMSEVQATQTEQVQHVTKITFKEAELKRIELPDQKGIVVRFLEVEGKTYVDIRKFYKGYPTKKGIRMTLSSFKALKELL